MDVAGEKPNSTYTTLLLEIGKRHDDLKRIDALSSKLFDEISKLKKDTTTMQRYVDKLAKTKSQWNEGNSTDQVSHILFSLFMSHWGDLRFSNEDAIAAR